MNERIKKLVEYTLAGKMRPQKTPVLYDREDILLPPLEKSLKRVCEYILAQTPVLCEESAMTGLLLFDGSVEGDVFHRAGHTAFGSALSHFYNKPLHNLVTLEWQHSTANFEEIIQIGIVGIKRKIEISKKAHENDPDSIEFLNALSVFCDTIIKWAYKCSQNAAELAQSTENEEYKNNLLRLSDSLKKVPQNPAESFYEAILSLYLCFSFDPDSIGLIDRYLYPYYKHDIENGIITEEDAKAYLQDLFLMLQSHTDLSNKNFTRGGESHFAIGGYLPNGEDGFNELSHLIVEALMELPTYIPQITLRWTKKTPHEVFRYMMDHERHDPNKRIAFVNDEPKIEAFMKHLDMQYSDAVNYTMVGCNEVAFPGGIYMGTMDDNILRSVELTFKNRREQILSAADFDSFYDVYEEQLFSDIEEMLEYEDKFNLLRAKDVNIVSSIFFKGCIERAKSVTQGGPSICSAGLDFIGLPNVFDSLTVVKQFVYDEKLITMHELIDALDNNWEGYEDMRVLIKKRGKFFGNDYDISNEIAIRFTDSVYRFLKDKRSVFGYKYLVGNLVGYNEHHKFFGSLTGATPDGRKNGEMFKFGLGQSNGYDREGLAALLNSVSKCDPHHILHGPTVTNVTLDEQLMTNDVNFEKTVKLFETYFENGGIHFQLTYVSKEDMIKAKCFPDDYKHLRVRVSGFSDYFVKLNEALQDDIIARTEQK